ncbi:N-acetylglucosamine kinase 1 [Ciborinia camelliae]|nr:N-acetylglucosamine kinase 1 [Ciborinia camelliae]
MLKIRQAFYAAFIRSCLKTKSILEIIIKFWISPPSSTRIKDKNADVEETSLKKVKKFLDEVEDAFEGSTKKAYLVALSDGLRKEFAESLLENPQNMLPSYNHQLPNGYECGTYLALDVGGSTFRVALIKLAGKECEGKETEIVELKSFKITIAERRLVGAAFFDWMADRIADTLAGQNEGHEKSKAPLSVGLSWSFPIEQTSLRGGLLMGMGKGFCAAHGLVGKDLGDLIEDSCSKKGLNVQLNAIVNDASATLLSKAYIDPTTCFALILGTGLNAAAHLPVHIFSQPKFGIRPASWHECAKHVIVNTELSMFGGKILPYTRWDENLKATHPAPDFQPFEHFASGGYIGEIVRLILIDGIQSAGLFGGIVPTNLKENDKTPNLTSAIQIFTTRHPSPHTPTVSDLHAIRLIASRVTLRSSGLIAAAIHSLWHLRNASESISPSESAHTIVAYNGSVLENYPNFRNNTQKHLDILVEASGAKSGTVELMYAEESSLLGAAVAVACCDA